MQVLHSKCRIPRCPRSGSAELEASALLIVRLVPGLQRLRIPGALIAVAGMSGAVSFHLFTPPGIDPNNHGAGLFAMVLVVWLCPIAMQIAGRGVLIEPDSAVARVLLPHRALSTEGPALILMLAAQACCSPLHAFPARLVSSFFN
jgi:hypothetical protein